MTSNTFGTTCGRAIGRVAATSVHAVAVTATATGRFGQDLVTGASAGYQEHNARLAALREQARIARELAKAKTTPIGVVETA